MTGAIYGNAIVLAGMLVRPYGKEANVRRPFGDGTSLLSLDPDWQPKQGASFALKDFVKYALGH